MLDITIHGSGPAVVLLHGFCETKAIWDHYISVLSKNNTLVCLDLPGFGKSTETEAETIEDFANQVQQTLHHYGIGPYVVVGHSLGGYVALAMAESEPKALRGLSMFHSTAFADSDEKKANRLKTIQFVKDNGVNAFIEPFVPPLFHPQNRKACAPAIEKLIQIGCLQSEKAIIRAAHAMRNRPDRRHVIQGASYPVQYIIGKDDQAVRFDDSLQQCHLAADSQCLFLANTAHQGMFERPEATLAAVVHFVAYCYK